MPSIKITDTFKSYNGTLALDCLNLEIGSGEVMGLLGPNGAGKTTLISILSSVFRQDSGEIEISDEGGNNIPEEYKMFIGVAPQDISLYSELNPEENLIFFSRMYNVERNVLKENTMRLLALAGLEKRKKDRVKTLSGGMKRRLNFACALVNSPRIVFLDEPTAGVDPQSREHIYSMVKQLKAEGVTTILATHYMSEAETLCDRIAIMESGKVRMVHSVEEYMNLFGEKLGLEKVNMEKIFLHITGRELRD